MRVPEGSRNLDRQRWRAADPLLTRRRWAGRLLELCAAASIEFEDAVAVDQKRRSSGQGLLEAGDLALPDQNAHRFPGYPEHLGRLDQAERLRHTDLPVLQNFQGIMGQI